MSAYVGRSLGRYRLEALLGQGGMAEVHRATDTKLARTVAVKVIRATHAVKGDFLERFLREARMVASLEHPNILPVYDFGEENGVPYLVMPCLSGGSLRERLKAGAAPLALASAWIVELADALDAAHAAGVLHRDVKPANVLLGRNDRLFLADFGIAKMLESESGLTATGVVVGTPIYMAPEQAQGRPATPATDRYALAVVAYEILCGRPPFEGDSALSLMHQHVSNPPPPLSTRIGGLPAGLDAVLAQALAKDPAARPPTCRALADAVAAFAPAGIAPPPSTPPPVRLSGARPSITSDATRLVGSRGTARRAMAFGAVALAGLAGAWLIVPRRPSRESVPLAAPPAPSPVSTAAPPAQKAPATVPPAPTPPTASAPASTAPASAAAAERAEMKPEPPALPRKATANPPIPPPPLEAGTRGTGLPAAPGDVVRRLIAVRERLEPGRTHARSLSREDFQFVLDEARAVLRDHPRNPDAIYLLTYARGGLAYIAGKDPLASALLVEAFTELRRTSRRDVRPIVRLLLRTDGTIGQPNGWELALGYGDARGEAMGLIEKELAANPRSPRALRARAQLRKMRGLDEGRLN